VVLEHHPRLRAVLAGGLAALYPGLGHAMLWRWRRALGWFALSLATALLVVTLSDVTVPAGGLEGALELQRQLPLEATLVMLAVSGLNVVDAVRVAREQHATAGSEPAAGTCPSCGNELDEDLDFCPWCTTRL